MRQFSTQVILFLTLPVPLLTIGIFIVVAFTWGLLSDGPCRGARWPFIYAGAVITVSEQHPASFFYVISYNKLQVMFCALLRQMPLYSNVDGRMAVYWLSQTGVSLSSRNVPSVLEANADMKVSWERVR